MAEGEVLGLELYYNPNISQTLFTSVLIADFDMPDTQAEQVYFILSTKNKITLFKNSDKNYLEKSKDIFEGLDIDSKIVSYGQ